MLPFQRNDELFFQISSNLNVETLREVTFGTCSGDKSNVYGNKRDPDPPKRDDRSKRIVHRDIERQRRQEMSNLHSTLLSLLPSEFVKGKRSMSDHMHEAANYIKHLQRKIKERGAVIDELKRTSCGGAVPSPKEVQPSGSLTVRPSLDGIEVVFSSEPKDGVLTLSKVLELLLEEGATAVSCVCTRVRSTLFHIIQAEANDLTPMNILELQRKLNSLNTTRTSW